MSALTAAIEELILTAVLSERAPTPRKSKTDWALIVLSVLFASTGVAFLVAALSKYLGDIYPPVMAALICAGLLFAGSIVSIIMMRCMQASRSSTKSTHHNLTKNLHTIIEEIFLELEDPIKENPKTAILVAALAGFMAANQQNRL